MKRKECKKEIKLRLEYMKLIELTDFGFTETRIIIFLRQVTVKNIDIHKLFFMSKVIAYIEKTNNKHLAYF